MDNQNTFNLYYHEIKKYVLILVLMDNQNTFKLPVFDSTELVLILVLMDNQNTYLRKQWLDSGSS